MIEKCDDGISFSKSKMAAATMLDFSYHAFFDAIVEFLFKVATLLPNLVKISLKL